MCITPSLKRYPKNNDTYVDRSNINIALARWTDVLTNCDAYLAMHPENKSMHVKRGDALNHLGRDQEAIAELAPNLQKEDPRSMGLLGASYRNLHQYQKAIDMSTNWLNQIGPEPGLLTVKADSDAISNFITLLPTIMLC